MTGRWDKQHPTWDVELQGCTMIGWVRRRVKNDGCDGCGELPFFTTTLWSELGRNLVALMLAYLQ
jgi:hypothetical protein